jgi:hypothetical protein
MNDTPTPPEEIKTYSKDSKTECFINSGNPSLVLRTLKGRRWGWPLTSLSEWFYEPKAYTPDDGSGMKASEKLIITSGLRQVEVLGLCLDKVCAALEMGAGVELIERGVHFRSLAKKGEVYIDSIQVTDSDGANPSVNAAAGEAAT